MQIHSKIFLCLLAALHIGLMTNCKKDDDKPGDATAVVQLRNHPTLGKILTDKDGRTLYFFADDATGANTCTAGCEAGWPLFNGGALTKAQLAAGLDLADFGSITSLSGKTMTTYKGWPLYYFAPNGVLEAAGETKGEGVGKVWFVAKPDYTIMLANKQLVGNDGKNYKSDYTVGEGKTVYFTAPSGMTLYVFTQDRNLDNNFTNPDFSNNGAWPIYDKTEVVVPSTLDRSLFNVIDVFGRKQLTYKGWPLYHFGGDNNTRGNTKGVSVPTPGIWPVAVQNLSGAPQ